VRELSLFSGAGGGLLGTYLLGFSPVGYVEFSDYCQRVLKQRIKDGVFPEAPIFGDIKAFIGEGYAESYTGMVDVITAGFPCQEFSVAGARAGSSGERNMWPETWTAIRTIRPRAVFLENVPGLLTSGVEADPDIDISYFGSILADLAEIGYSEIRYCILGADDVGAPHRRKRLWILGYSKRKYAGGNNTGKSSGIGMEMERNSLDKKRWNESEYESHTSSDVADSNEKRKPGLSLRATEKHSSPGVSSKVADSKRDRRGGNCRTLGGGDNSQPFGKPEKISKDGQRFRDETSGCGKITWWDIDPADLPDTENPPSLRGNGELSADCGPGLTGEGKESDGRRGLVKSRLGLLAPRLAHRYDLTGTFIKGPVPRVATGVRDRVSRLKAIGNGQVSLCAATAWEILTFNLDT